MPSNANGSSSKTEGGRYLALVGGEPLTGRTGRPRYFRTSAAATAAAREVDPTIAAEPEDVAPARKAKAARPKAARPATAAPAAPAAVVDQSPATPDAIAPAGDPREIKTTKPPAEKSAIRRAPKPPAPAPQVEDGDKPMTPGQKAIATKRALGLLSSAGRKAAATRAARRATA